MTVKATERTPTPSPASSGLTIDADYLRAQAGEALATFVAPLLGVVGAATGKQVRLARRKSRTRKAA